MRSLERAARRRSAAGGRRWPYVTRQMAETTFDGLMKRWCRSERGSRGRWPAGRGTSRRACAALDVAPDATPEAIVAARLRRP